MKEKESGNEGKIIRFFPRVENLHKMTPVLHVREMVYLDDHRIDAQCAAQPYSIVSLEAPTATHDLAASYSAILDDERLTQPLEGFLSKLASEDILGLIGVALMKWQPPEEVGGLLMYGVLDDISYDDADLKKARKFLISESSQIVIGLQAQQSPLFCEMGILLANGESIDDIAPTLRERISSQIDPFTEEKISEEELSEVSIIKTNT